MDFLGWDIMGFAMDRQTLLMVAGGSLLVLWILGRLPWKKMSSSALRSLLELPSSTEAKNWKQVSSARRTDTERPAAIDETEMSRPGVDRLDELLEQINELNNTRRWVRSYHVRLTQQVEALKTWLKKAEDRLRTEDEQRTQSPGG